MPKYLTNSKFFDDGQGTHIENGFVECLDLFINQISVEDLIQASIDVVEGEITTLQTQVNGLISTFTLTGTYYDGTLNALFVSNSDLRVTKILYLYDASGNNPYSLNAFVSNTNNSISNINTTLHNCSYNSTFNAFQIGGDTDLRVLNTLYLYTGGVPYSLNTFVSNTNTNLGSVVTKTTDISYASGTTTIGNNLVINNIDGFSKARFDNAINFTYDLSSNAQTQIDGAYAAAAAAGAAGAAAASAALVAANANTTAEILVVTTAQTAVNTGFEADITALEGKTATMTYDVNNNVVNFASKLTANSFGGISCDSLTVDGGINQTHNSDNYLIGNTYVRNFMRFQYGFGLDIQNGGSIWVDGSANIRDLVVGGLSTINGNLTASGAQTNLNSTNTQIGTGSAQTLTINSSTVIPASNMTFQYGSLRTNSIQNYNGGSLSVDVSGNSLQLNSQTINVGTNQGVAALNSINIGALTSASIINLNGIVNCYSLNMTGLGIFSQF